MLDNDTQSRHKEEKDPTLQQTVTLLKTSLTNYTNARKELAAIEMHEAKDKLVTSASSIAIIAFCGFFSYVLFLVFIIAFGGSLLKKYTQTSMGRLWELCEPWMFLTLFMCVIHLILLFTFFDILNRASKKKLFVHTLAELKNDQTWLKQNKSNKES